MEQNYRSLRSENYQLREYILNLQSLLVENHSSFPPAPTQTTQEPPPVDRSNRSAVDQQLHREMDVPRTSLFHHDALSQLQAAAAQASDPRAADPQHGLNVEHGNRRARADDPVGDAKPVS